MIKPHIKVIQRNGVDIFITSSITNKLVKSKLREAVGVGMANFVYMGL